MLFPGGHLSGGPSHESYLCGGHGRLQGCCALPPYALGLSRSETVLGFRATALHFVSLRLQSRLPMPPSVYVPHRSGVEMMEEVVDHSGFWGWIRLDNCL
jgi:hypothetical protein